MLKLATKYKILPVRKAVLVFKEERFTHEVATKTCCVVDGSLSVTTTEKVKINRCLGCNSSLDLYKVLDESTWGDNILLYEGNDLCEVPDYKNSSKIIKMLNKVFGT